MSLKKRVYLCGPISLGGTLPLDERSANIIKFMEEEQRLTNLGWIVENPIKYGSPNLSWTENMKIVLTIMLTCDIVAIFPLWMDSEGCKLERFIAQKLSIPVIKVEDL